MIPRDFITEWRAFVPWVEDAQVEQDLVISRAIAEIYSVPRLASALAFRGGTALYKLYIQPPARYSEDIDLVQVEPGAIGPLIDALRSTLRPWLGQAQWKQNEGRVTLFFRFPSSGEPSVPLRLKVEINTREHFSVLGYRQMPFSISSRWAMGTASVLTYDPNELLGTKMRALFQRKKARDLFDLCIGLRHPDARPELIVSTFLGYMDRSGHPITRAIFEENLAAKLSDPNSRPTSGRYSHQGIHGIPANVPMLS